MQGLRRCMQNEISKIKKPSMKHGCLLETKAMEKIDFLHHHELMR